MIRLKYKKTSCYRQKNIKKLGLELFFILFVWQYKKILRIFTKNFLKRYAI